MTRDVSFGFSDFDLALAVVSGMHEQTAQAEGGVLPAQLAVDASREGLPFGFHAPEVVAGPVCGAVLRIHVLALSCRDIGSRMIARARPGTATDADGHGFGVWWRTAGPVRSATVAADVETVFNGFRAIRALRPWRVFLERFPAP